MSSLLSSLHAPAFRKLLIFQLVIIPSSLSCSTHCPIPFGSLLFKMSVRIKFKCIKQKVQIPVTLKKSNFFFPLLKNKSGGGQSGAEWQLQEAARHTDWLLLSFCSVIWNIWLPSSELPHGGRWSWQLQPSWSILGRKQVKGE